MPQQEIADNYTVIRELGCGTYGRVLLATCHRTRMQVALKVLSKKTTKLDDFLREFNISYYLSPHRAIIKTYDVAFESSSAFVFAQEFAPVGDLFEAITPQVGLPEHHAKSVARQVVSALEFMHSKNLVHRDIKPENIMLFDEQFHRLKLMDFGLTKKQGTQVRKVSNGIPYTPPEICEAFKGDCYSVETSADVWAFAILLYCTLTGNFPWELANVTDSYYVEFLAWQRRKSTKIPSQWTRFWPRSLQMFRKLLEIKPDRRCPISDVTKFIEDEWLIKTTPNGNSSAVDHSVSGSSFTGSTNNHHHVTHESPSTRVSHYAGAIETTRFSKPALHDRRIKDWLLTT